MGVVGLLNYLIGKSFFRSFRCYKQNSKFEAEPGLLTPAFLWVYGIFSPLVGFLADRASRKSDSCQLACLVSRDMADWSRAKLLTITARPRADGTGELKRAGIPAALALIADYHSERTRSLATGLHQSGLYAGMILGGALGGWIGQTYGWRAAFTALGLVGVMYALILMAE
ncbi:MAG: MFS transporter [Blastocatellia bacterium]